MKQKEYIIVLGSILIVVILWGIFTVYHNLSTSTIDPNENLIVVPIDGTFDRNTINKVKTRKRVDVTLSSLSSPSASSTPTPKPSPTPVSSKSAALTLTPTPTTEPTTVAQP